MKKYVKMLLRKFAVGKFPVPRNYYYKFGAN